MSNWAARNVVKNQESQAVSPSSEDLPVSTPFAAVAADVLVVDVLVEDLVPASGVVFKLQGKVGDSWVDIKSRSASVQTRQLRATFQEPGSTGSGDYLVLEDSAGLLWAAAADLTGSDPAPTGAVWTSIPGARKTLADLSSAATAEDVALAFDTAFNSLTGFGDSFNTDWTFVPGSVNIDELPAGSANSTATPHNSGDTGAGSITTEVIAPGGAPTTYSITLSPNDSLDIAALPLRSVCRVAVSTGGSASVTVTAVYVSGLWPA